MLIFPSVGVVSSHFWEFQAHLAIVVFLNMYVLSHLPAVLALIVRGGIFQLLGRLCELYPEIMTCHSEGLIKIMAGTLKLENGKNNPDMPVIGGCLKGLFLPD